MSSSKVENQKQIFLFRNASHSNKFGPTSTRDFFQNLKNQNYVSAQRTHVKSFLSFQIFLKILQFFRKQEWRFEKQIYVFN